MNLQQIYYFSRIYIELSVMFSSKCALNVPQLSKLIEMNKKILVY